MRVSRIRAYAGCCVVGFTVFLSGCGGGGSSPSVGNSLVVEPMKLADGSTWSVGLVRDDGLVYGKQGSTGFVQPDSIWPSPGQFVTIPKIDDKAVFQNLDGVSADQQTILGSTIDINNSGGPGRAFVYGRKTGTFQMLQIASSDQDAPYPESIQADGTIVGWTQAPNNYGIGGQQFVYNLSTNTYTLTTPPYWSGNPNFPQGATVQGSCSSPNSRFVGGSLILNGHDQAAIWDMQTATYRLVGPKDGGYQATHVSNDGATAIINSNRIGQPYFLLHAGKLTDLISLCQSQGIGANWQWLTFVSLSPSGNYLTFTGIAGGAFGNAVRIRVY